MKKFEDRVFGHMELQKRLMEACGVFKLTKDEQLEVTFLNIAGESLEVLGFVLDKTKPWKSSELNYDDIKEELIDVYHFFLQLLVITELYEEIDFQQLYKLNLTLEMFKDELKINIEESAEYARWYMGERDLIFFIENRWVTFVNLFLFLNMTPEEVDVLYRAKNTKNFLRIKEKLGGSN